MKPLLPPAFWRGLAWVVGLWFVVGGLVLVLIQALAS